MQVDDATAAAFHGTDLEALITVEDGRTVMRRDPTTNICSALRDGLCSIHATYGPEALADTCYVYPAVVRQIGEEHIVSATLSCPETARLFLSADDATDLDTRPYSRIPSPLTRHRDDTGGVALHRLFIDSVTSDIPPAASVARIFLVCSILTAQPRGMWRQLASIALSQPPPPLGPAVDADIYRLVHIMFGLIHAGGGMALHPRMETVIEQIEKTIGIHVNRATLDLSVPDVTQWSRLRARTADNDLLLRRFLRAYLSMTTFPIAGPGETPLDKARVLAYRFVLTRVALRAFDSPDFDTTVMIVQEISRALDHSLSAPLLLNFLNGAGLGDAGRFITILNW